MSENKVETSNNRGEFVPAIPLPLFLRFGRVACGCGKKFPRKERYREHYALAHILASESWTKPKNMYDLPWAVGSVVGVLTLVGAVRLACSWAGVL